MADAKTHALLVGVADYNEASGIQDLLGPRNDVSILWRALKARGVDPADITVLTDSLPSGENFPVAKGLAQSANILNELDRLAQTAARATRSCSIIPATAPASRTIRPSPKDEPEADGMDQCCCRRTSAPMTRSR